jgi:hypothetical protein
MKTVYKYPLQPVPNTFHATGAVSAPDCAVDVVMDSSLPPSDPLTPEEEARLDEVDRLADERERVSEDDRETRARKEYNPRDERENRQYATIRLGFECYYSEALGRWTVDSREFMTGTDSAERRADALSGVLATALRVLADKLDEGESACNRLGDQVVEWSDTSTPSTKRPMSKGARSA